MRHTSNHRTKLKKSKIKAIFFDLGGVIVWGPENTLSIALARIIPVSKKRLARVVARHTEKLHRSEINVVQFAKIICAYFRVIPPTPAEIRRQFVVSYMTHKKISRSLLKLTQALRQRYCVGIISDTILEHAKVNRARGIFKIFKPVILSHIVGLCKPDKAIFHLALKRVGVKPREAIFIDDLAENVKGAKRVGMRAIRFKNLRQLKWDLKRLGITWK